MTFDYFYPDQAEQFAFFRIPKVLFRDQRFKPISTDAKSRPLINCDETSPRIEISSPKSFPSQISGFLPCSERVMPFAQSSS